MTVASPPPPPQNPYTPQPPVGPKKTSPWVWVGVGCLVLLLLGCATCVFIGYKAKQKFGSVAEDFQKNPELAGVKLAIQMNPDLELVSSDEAAKTVVVRDKKSGKEMTLNFEDIKNGKFSMEGSDGEKVNIGGGTSNLPDWLPAYPGATATNSFSANGESTTMLSTTDSSDQALTFYEEKLKEAGFTVEKNAYQVNNQTAGGTISAKSDDKGTVSVAIVGQSGNTTITITHTTK
ncbi:MAG TPA: hypothetical protein VN851_07730 [Thermoanaerobaculia bacterium]|nr:hypothetical protein [Thermoanaerobaculia bacterium]